MLWEIELDAPEGESEIAATESIELVDEEEEADGVSSMDSCILKMIGRDPSRIFTAIGKQTSLAAAPSSCPKYLAILRFEGVTTMRSLSAPDEVGVSVAAFDNSPDLVLECPGSE